MARPKVLSIGDRLDRLEERVGELKTPFEWEREINDELRARIAQLEAALWKERATAIALQQFGYADVRGDVKESVLTMAYEELRADGLLPQTAVETTVNEPNS